MYVGFLLYIGKKQKSRLSVVLLISEVDEVVKKKITV